MNLRRDKVRELMEVHCSNNYNEFARQLDISVAHLHRFLVSGIGGGKKIVGAILKFCKEKGLDFNDYVEL